MLIVIQVLRTLWETNKPGRESFVEVIFLQIRFLSQTVRSKFSFRKNTNYATNSQSSFTFTTTAVQLGIPKSTDPARRGSTALMSISLFGKSW